MATPQEFFRLGVVRIPFSASSAATPFDMMGKIPQNADGTIRDDLTFLFVNQTPYDIRLDGTPAGGAFTPVTSTTGWPIMARTVMGAFTSKKPAQISVQAFSTPATPLTGSEDFSGCVIELVYGRGK